MGKLYYIMGKSATGKDHIYRALAGDTTLGLSPLVLYTTRPKRRGETDGKEYHFVDEERLDALRDSDKVLEERVYQTVEGPWHYATVDDGQMDLSTGSYLAIGTLDSYTKLRAHYGDSLVPLYVETDDETRLLRAIKREKKQPSPNYAELCRRFLADTDDFSDDKLADAGIKRRFLNNATLDGCIEEIRDCILRDLAGCDKTSP